MNPKLCLVFLLLLFFSLELKAQESAFTWPEGKQMALSLSFDDGRASQVEAGVPLFNTNGAKATFYVMPSAIEEQLNLWQNAVAQGHEIGNHSQLHPCSGNFLWSRHKALEDYSLERMEEELREANKEIETLLNTAPATFAYPCGQNYVGRGEQTESYVPLVARMFSSGRGWMDEAPNDPAYCELSQITGISMDAKSFEEILNLIENAHAQGAWLVLAGHDIGEKGAQTTRLSMLEKLLEYVKNPDHGIWLAPVGKVSEYIIEAR